MPDIGHRGPSDTALARFGARFTPVRRLLRQVHGVEFAMMRGINDQGWRRSAGRRAQCSRRLPVGAPGRDPAKPDAGLEVDRLGPEGRARVRATSGGRGHLHDGVRHPRLRHRRRPWPARRDAHRRLSRDQGDDLAPSLRRRSAMAVDVRIDQSLLGDRFAVHQPDEVGHESHCVSRREPRDPSRLEIARALEHLLEPRGAADPR